MVANPSSRRRFVAVSAVVVLALSACSDDTPGEADGSSTSTSAVVTTTSTAVPSTTSTTLSAQDATIHEAFDAYVQATEVFIEIAEQPDPADPRIAATSTGAMLQNRIQDLGTLRAEGKRIAYPAESVFRMELIEGSGEIRNDELVVFTACFADDSWEQDIATGQPASGSVKTVEATVAMVLEDGVWKVAEQVFENRLAGVAGCAEGWA